MAQSLFQNADPRQEALRDLLDLTLRRGEAGFAMAALIAGLDVAYDPDPPGHGDVHHPLVGRRMPDLDLITADGHTRVFELLHDARPLLLTLDGSEARRQPTGRIRAVTALTPGPWELPVLGEVPTPTGVLVRPDGHVAWVGEGTTDGLTQAATAWL